MVSITDAFIKKWGMSRNIEVLKMLTKMIQSLQKKREEEGFGSTIREIVEEYLP